MEWWLETGTGTHERVLFVELVDCTFKSEA